MSSYFDEFATGYWKYYLQLESRMEETQKFVEYDEANFKTFSSTYLMLFQTVCSEIDVVGKEIAGYYNPTFVSEKDNKKTINRWWYEIQDQIPDINREIIFAEKINVNPWSKFRTAKTISYRNAGTIEVVNYNLQKKTNGVIYNTPKWWNAYNKVKHHRLASDVDGVNFKKANLQNLVNAFAALYLLEFEFMKKIGTTKERIRYEGSVLFGMGDLQDHFIDSMFVNGETLEFGNSKKKG